MPYLLFLKKRQNLKLSSAANYGYVLRVKEQCVYKIMNIFHMKQLDTVNSKKNDDFDCGQWLLY